MQANRSDGHPLKPPATLCGTTVLRVSPQTWFPNWVAIRFDVADQHPFVLEATRDSIAAFALLMEGVSDRARRKQLMYFLCEAAEVDALRTRSDDAIRGCIDLADAFTVAADAVLRGDLGPKGETIRPWGQRLADSSLGLRGEESWAPYLFWDWAL